MSSVEHQVEDPRVAELRLRLYDAAADLSPARVPIDGPDKIRERLITVLRELHSIERDFLLFLHCNQLEEHGIADDVEKIAGQVQEGRYEPDIDPDLFVQRLRDRLAASR